MLFPLFVAVLVLIISCIFFWRLPLRIRRLGLFSLGLLEYRKCHRGAKPPFGRAADWSIGEDAEYSANWAPLLQAIAFGIRISGIRIRFSVRQLKFALSIDSIEILLSPATREATQGQVSSSTPRKIPIRLIRLLRLVLSTILAAVGAFWTFKIGRINLLLTQFPQSIPQDRVQFWNCLQLAIHQIAIFDAKRALKIDKCRGVEIHIDEGVGRVVEQRKVLHIDPIEFLSTKGISVPHPASHHGLSTSSLCIHLWPTTLLLLTSMAFNAKGQSRERPLTAPPPPPPPEEESGNDVRELLNVLVPLRTILSLKIDTIDLQAHYPVSSPGSRRFEAFRVALSSFQASVCAQPKETVPQLVATAARVSMAAVGAEEVGGEMISKISRLLGISFNGLEEDLLVLTEVILSNCWCLDEYREHQDDALVARWTGKVVQGQPVWGISSEPDPEFDRTMSAVKPSLESLYVRVVEHSQPFYHYRFHTIPQTALLQASQIRFDVPFEFPLSNYFDHLTYLIKIAQSPFRKRSDRQDFCPFAHTWKLRVMSEDCRFTIADDPFERRLQKCLLTQKLLHNKLSRMDRIFWDFCKKETIKVGGAKKGTKDPRWVSHSLKTLADASAHPELLRANPYLLSCYVRLQQKFFTIYRDHFMASHPEQESLLFRASARNVDFALQWERDFVDDLSVLLNSIDGEETFTMAEVREFGLFLGGFLDVSANDLVVALRNYSVPLCAASGARIAGLVFLLEEPSYPAAKSKLLIPVSDLTGQWNHSGSDEQARVAIQKAILPLKVYHSLQLSIVEGGSGEPAISGFSPLYEGAFQMLDRAFELFSKPSEEPSPFLPFWDKLRLLMRGTSSSIMVRTQCHFLALLGQDVHSRDECISLAFPEGFCLGLDGPQIRLRLPRAVAFMNSQSEAVLRWQYQTCGQAFYAKDRLLLDASIAGGGQIPIVSFPKVEFCVLFEMLGADGQRPISHSSVRIRAGRPQESAVEDGDGGITGQGEEGGEQQQRPQVYDSYRLFRINKLNLFITITADDENVDKVRRLLVFYYRELEDWFVKGFGRFVTPPVKSGTLFKFSTLSKKATPKLSSVMNDVRFRLDFDGIFMVRGLQFYDDKNFGGLLLLSEGRTRLIFAWRKGTRHASNPLSGQWFNHFAEITFATTMIGMLAPWTAEHFSRLMSTSIPEAYENVAFFEVLNAPLLFYLKVNQACFKADPESQIVQGRLITSRLQELNLQIDAVAHELRQCDPTVDMQGFTNTRRRLSVLLEQQALISRFAPSARGGTPSDPRALISYYQIIIQHARLLWHQSVRNAVFSLVDQQFQFFRIAKAFGSLAESAVSAERTRGSVIATTPIGSPPPSASESDSFMQALIMGASPFEVGPEAAAAEEAEEGAVQREELMMDPEQLRQSGVTVSVQIDFDLISPQIILIDTKSDAEEAAIVITAQSASLKYGTVNFEERGPIVGRRSKIVLEQAVMFAAFKSELGEKHWPPVYPIEYLLSQETETTRFHRISEKVRATFVYDVANARFQGQRGLYSPLRSIFGQGDTLRVDLDTLALMTTSAEYSVLYNVIVNLMVYRDETQKMRSEQLESLILATNLLQQSDLVNTVRKMQDDTALHLCMVTGKLQRALVRGEAHRPALSEEFARMKASLDDIALIVDALQTASANREKLRQRQTRLLLDVIIGKIQWALRRPSEETLCEMALLGIHDAWLSAPDGTQSNLVEIQALRAKNCLQNAFYQTLFCPLPEEVRNAMYTDSSGFRGIGTQGNSIRFYFKAQPPVSGIPIVEHVELNLAPQQVQLTRDIAEEFIKFFFPERGGSQTPKDPAAASKAPSTAAEKSSTTAQAETAGEPGAESLLGGLKSGIKSTAASFISRFNEQMDDEDVALMTVRSAENCSFVYINVPASQHLISYKGPGDKSITDVENFILKLPDFEYHSHLWSWLEFTLQLKRDMIKVVLSNVSALLKDKIRRLGQANVPESEGESTRRVLQKLSAGAKVREDPDSKEAQVLQIPVISATDLIPSTDRSARLKCCSARPTKSSRRC